MSTQPEALRLADELQAPVGTQSTYSAMHQAAAELRRLHAENASLSAALAASCDEARDQLWESGMTREQYLNILILISTLESLILAHKVTIPDHLFASMELATEQLRDEVLKE